MKRLASIIVAGLAGAAASGALAGRFDDMVLRCDFEPVEEVGQPARHVEVRRGAWDDDLDMLDVFEDGELVHLWVEEGLPARPVWPPMLNLATGGMTYQHWAYDGVTSLLTFDRFTLDGTMQAVLSTHDARNPPHTVASTAVGTCVISEGG